MGIVDEARERAASGAREEVIAFAAAAGPRAASNSVAQEAGGRGRSTSSVISAVIGAASNDLEGGDQLNTTHANFTPCLARASAIPHRSCASLWPPVWSVAAGYDGPGEQVGRAMLPFGWDTRTKSKHEHIAMRWRLHVAKDLHKCGAARAALTNGPLAGRPSSELARPPIQGRRTRAGVDQRAPDTAIQGPLASGALEPLGTNPSRPRAGMPLRCGSLRRTPPHGGR